MKNIFYIILLFNAMVYSQAVVGISTTVKAEHLPLVQLNVDNMKNNTFVDIDNDLNQYIGTWLYHLGNTSFKIVLQKKNHVFDSELNSYFDMLIGEYEYIENGVTIINTLPLLDNASVGDFNHNIYGYILFKNNSNMTTTATRRVKLEFKDPTYPHLDFFIFLRQYEDVGHFIDLKMSSYGGILTQDLPIVFRVPGGFYILEKQH